LVENPCKAPKFRWRKSFQPFTHARIFVPSGTPELPVLLNEETLPS
jgi:hypothetical protein